MRVIILLIVIIAALVVIQNQRNHCTWGQPGWGKCITTLNQTGTAGDDVSP
jgi:hypothetical protein